MPLKPRADKGPAASQSKKKSLYESINNTRKSIFGISKPEPLYADRLATTLKEGDVVLFYGKQIHDAVIRCCTGSEYNHVAMVVKDAYGELELFEAAALGVAKVPLEFYINSYYWTHMRGMFHKVVIRQLHTKEAGRGITTKMRAELVRFQHEMLGRKFCLNPIRYMNAILSIPHREDMSSSFCSQLVAGSYKRMGLLPEEKAASNYLPKHFSTKGSANLPLQNGAWLGPERELVFDETPILAPRPSTSRMQSSDLPSRLASSKEDSASELASSRTLVPTTVFKDDSIESLAEMGGGAPIPGSDPDKPAKPREPKKQTTWGAKASRRVSQMLFLVGSTPEPAPPTAEELEERKRAAEAALAHAIALYKLRAWMRRHLRNKERRKRAEEQKLLEESGEAEESAATPGQVAVEIRRD